MQNCSRPNLLEIATSEISQDAILVYLIMWSDPQYEESDKSLHLMATKFVRKLLAKDEDYLIKSVNAGRQYKKIDVWADINGTDFIALEDKTNTSHARDQLKRYKLDMEKDIKYIEHKKHFIYLKTGNENAAKAEAVKGYDYRAIYRHEFLDILLTYKSENVILLDLIDKLSNLETKTSDLSLDKIKTCKLAGEGFFCRLESYLLAKGISKLIDEIRWDTIPQKDPFLALWYNYVHFTQYNYQLKIQIENHQYKPEIRLQIKISVDESIEKSERKTVAIKVYNELYEFCKDTEVTINKRRSPGKGNVVTVLEIENAFLPDIEGNLDMNQLFKTLGSAEALIANFCNLKSSMKPITRQ